MGFRMWSECRCRRPHNLGQRPLSVVYRNASMRRGVFEVYGSAALLLDLDYDPALFVVVVHPLQSQYPVVSTYPRCGCFVCSRNALPHVGVLYFVHRGLELHLL